MRNINITLTVSFLMAAFLASESRSSHRPGLEWMGIFCCKEYDCHETTVIVLDEKPLITIVQIGEDVVEVSSYKMKPSKDAHTYVCFVATKGSYIDAEGIKRAVPPEHFRDDNIRCVFYGSFG